MKRRILFVTILGSLIGQLTALAQSPPGPYRLPPTPAHDVIDAYFGTKVVDPYRYLENLDDPKVATWMKAQNKYARASLDRIPGRAALLARIRALNRAGTNVSGLQIAGGSYLYFTTKPGESVPRLYLRHGLDGPERLLVDPERQATSGTHYSIDWFKVSPGGKYLAYGISPGGSEHSVLRVVETATGRDLGIGITRADFDFEGFFWHPDGESFFYNRLQEPKPGQPSSAYFANNRVYLHVIGRRATEDLPILGSGLTRGVAIAEHDEPWVVTGPGSSYALAVITHGVQPALTVYVAPLSAVVGSGTMWRKVADTADAIDSVALQGQQLYLLTHLNAPRRKVVRTTLSQPDLPHAEVVAPQSSAVIQAMRVAGDGLYLQEFEGGFGRLERLPFDGAGAGQVHLPFPGTIQTVTTDPAASGAVVRLTSWTRSPAYFAYDPATEAVTDTRLLAPSSVDFSGVESEEVRATSSDGTQVPLSILHRRGLARDGSNPALLVGYGAYGYRLDPTFVASRLAWLERGGILAVAHVRGGGEYGEEWHEAGQGAKKQNTISDFIGCARYLIARHYTSAARLAGQGRSAGGITIGGAITREPALFSAALIGVGELDPLRTEFAANGPENAAEFGSSATEAGFRGLLAISPYQQVRNHVRYPAVLLDTGINDPRVPPWTSAKMAARLQTASSSGRPILLRIDYEAGHGFGSTTSQSEELLADQYAFLSWQLGMPDFQLIR